MANKQPDSKPLKMVLLGKTGAGKSASGNTILGEKRFEAKPSFSSVTTECSTESRILGEQKLIVVDTPGLFNTKCDQKKLMKELVHFLLSVVTEQTPDAFLWVIKCGSFTREVKESIKIFKKVFEKATEHTIVLFTSGHEEKVKAFIEGNQGLKDFIKECNGLYQVFDNKNKDEKQVLELVEKINSMVKRNGKPYSSELLENAERAIEELKNQPEGLSKHDSIDLGLNFLEKCPRQNLSICIYTFFEKCIDAGIHHPDQQLPRLKAFIKFLEEVAYKYC